jgi:hypothetical protein
MKPDDGPSGDAISASISFRLSSGDARPAGNGRTSLFAAYALTCLAWRLRRCGAVRLW